MPNQPTKLDISTPKHPNTYTIIDFDMYAELSKNKWGKTSGGYCARNMQENNKKTYLRIHRLIMKAKPHEQVDHINGDKLDNRRCNLRICTQQDNKCNRRINTNNNTGFKGVRCRLNNQTWEARIKLNSKCLTLGRYKIKEHAAIAYNLAAKYLFKDFAFLNQILDESEITDQIKQKVEKRLAKYNLILENHTNFKPNTSQKVLAFE